jgi:hypothetical protein
MHDDMNISVLVTLKKTKKRETRKHGKVAERRPGRGAPAVEPSVPIPGAPPADGRLGSGG